jgi:predicted ATPase
MERRPDRELRSALTHLHDLPYLQTHPLDGRRGKELQRLLEAGLVEMGAGRTAELMRLRYAEALPSPEVATRLGISQGEYYREHQLGLAALASILEAPTASPAEPKPAGHVGKLPTPLTSFVGRGQELADVARALTDARLVTLTGPGGAGKTRLAFEVVRAVGDRFADGVCLVELDALFDPANVAPAVAARLGIPEQPGLAPVEAIARRLAPSTMLLVLDNCEHLAHACAQLVEELLATCLRLRVLTTSREPLGVPGEVVWAVPPLSPSEATRLFLERARAARRTFGLTVANEPVVARICERLDYLPLAIELAAARVRALGPEEIAARLNDRFHLLTGGGRTSPARQQTLRAVVDWTHGLLVAPERTLFRRLAVFTGGWTLAAAEAVCADAGLSNSDVLDLLARLVDRSLVVADEDGAGGLRYRLLETLRAYAHEQLVEADELDALRDGHLAWFLALAEGIEPDLWAAGLAAGLRLLEAEHDNLRAALDSGVSHKPAAALRLAAALSGFWIRRGHWSEGRRWLDAALARAALDADSRAAALVGAAFLARFSGEAEAAGAYASEALTVAQVTGDRRSAGMALQNLAALSQRAGNWDETQVLLSASIAHFRAVDFAWGIGSATSGLAHIAFQRGALPRARALFTEALSHHRRAGNPQGIAAEYGFLGSIALADGAFDESWRQFEESQRIASAAGLRNMPGTTLRLAVQAETAMALDRDDEAEGLLREAVAVARRTASSPSLLAVHLVGLLALRRGLPERAVRLMGAAHARGLGELGGRTLSFGGGGLAPAERMRYEASLARARAALSPESFEAAWSLGAAMTLEEAADYALSEDGSA